MWGMRIIWIAFRRPFRGLRLNNLDSVFESMNAAIFLLDKNNQVVDTNRMGEKLLNNSISQSLEILFRELADSYLDEYSRSLDAANRVNQTTLNIDGKIRTFQVHFSPIKNWRGEITKKIISLRDISEEERYWQETSALLDISTAVSSSLNIQEVLLIIAERLLELTHFNICEIYEWDGEMNKFFLLIEHGSSFWTENGSDKYVLDDDWPIERDVLHSGEPFFSTYEMDDPDAERYSSTIFVPILANGQSFGLIEVSFVKRLGEEHVDIMTNC